MHHILIEHMGGEKAGQREAFDVSSTPGILIGRDLAAQVRFSDAVDSVSRQHARIEFDAPHGGRVLLHDLGGRNGLFVNDAAVSGTVELHHGDRVRLGNGGPEFTVRFDPVPAPQPKATRLVQTPAATREVSVTDVVALPKQAGEGTATPRPASRETVERLVTQGQAKTRRHFAGLSIAVVAFAVVAGALAWGWIGKRDDAQQAAITQVRADVAGKADEVLRAAQAPKVDWKQRVAERYANSVVYIEASWRLIHKATRLPVYHQYGEVTIDNEKHRVPLFVIADGAFEPKLTTQAGAGRLIGGSHSGTGFVAHKNGFVLTNRHVASAWMTHMPDVLKCPCAVIANEKMQVVARATPEMAAAIRKWVPAQSRQGGGSSSSPAFFGENQLLEVAFANSKNRLAARVVNVSNQHDVAMMRIDVPFDVEPVPLADAGARPKPAQEVLVMGYPGLSPRRFEKVESQDAFARESRVVLVPAVSVASGTISQVSAPTVEGKDMGTHGDVYQLTVNATGSGNSGGPVFDDSGKVSSVFYAGSERVTYAVPIRYALELMERSGSGGN